MLKEYQVYHIDMDYFTGKSKKKFLKLLNYPIIKEYPKGDNKRYKFGDKKPDIIYNRKTGKYFTE